MIVDGLPRALLEPLLPALDKHGEWSRDLLLTAARFFHEPGNRPCVPERWVESGRPRPERL